MAIPHEIFKNIDHCHLAMDIWAELEKQIEGGTKTLKNNRAICIDEYHSFKAKEGESLSDTYARLNTLISNCKRYGVMRSSEDNNSQFLKSLGYEWINLTMSMKATLDLQVWTLADLFGSLTSQEPQILQLKNSYGGPLALVTEGDPGKDREPKKEEKEKKKKKVLIAESDESSEDEVSMQKMMKTLALITIEYRKGGEKKDYRNSEKSYRDNDRREGSERREREEQKKDAEGVQKKEEMKEGCFNCGKPGHFAAECWSKGPKMSQKSPKDAAYFKRKADYYQKKSLLAQTSELVTDDSSDEDAQKGLLALKEDTDTETEIFCGMASIQSDSSDTDVPKVSSFHSSESIDLYSEIIDNLDSCHLEHVKLNEKLSFYEKEVALLTEEKDKFFNMFKEAHSKFINMEKSSKEKLAKVEARTREKQCCFCQRILSKGKRIFASRHS